MRKALRHKVVMALAGVTIGAASVGFAGSLNLATNALELVTGVEPNIFVILDNSGSMDWELLTPEAELTGISGATGVMQVSVNANNYYGYCYVFAGSDNAYTTASFSNACGVAPSEAAVTALASGTADEQSAASSMTGVWRARLYDYNKVYYNHNRTYKYWPGLDGGGVAYGNATATAARNDPFTSTSGTVDLTANWTVTTKRPKGAAEGAGNTSLTFTYYPALYNVCTVSSSDQTEADCPSSASSITPTTGHKKIDIISTTASYTHKDTRTDCSTNNGNGTVTCTYAEEIQNFANWYSYHRRRELAAKAAVGNMVDVANFARIGFAPINYTSTYRLAVASMNVSAKSGNKKLLLDKLYATNSYSGTPLLSALMTTGNYFQCTSKNIFGYAASSPGDVNGYCPVQASPAGKCQQNYAILLSDGYYTGALNDDYLGTTMSTLGNTDQDGATVNDTNFDGGAYADTYSDTLGDVAMNFYEKDLHSTLDDEVPTTTRDRVNYPISGSTLGSSMHQHMGSYTIGFGVNGSISSMPATPTSAFTWTNPTSTDAGKVDDMRHAAYNGRGSFLDATDPATLDTGLSSIFEEIQAGVGAASAVAFNTQEIESGALVFRAFFNTKINTGDLVAQTVNTDGTIADEILWSAAAQLDSKVSSATDSRVIVTYNDTGTSTSAGTPFLWANLNATQMSYLNTPTPSSPMVTPVGSARVGYLRGQSLYEGTSYETGQFRERPSVEGKLGDIVHSSPVYVGEPPFLGRDASPFPTTAGSLYSEYKSANEQRTGVVFVGANDGMLHSFNASTGSELFSYVPNILFGDSSTGTYPLSLLTRPDYTHRYFVDLPMAVGDIYFTKYGAASPSWNSVLVGGLAGGGKGYFALNVTDPGTFTNASGAAANVMWEFTESDTGSVGNSDLGYSYSRPLIAMSNAADASSNKRWVVIFGNGYNSTTSDGDAALYILFIEGGQDGVWTANTDYIKISTGYGKAESSDGTTPNGLSGVRGIDYDGNGTVDYVYAGDLQGNLFRFDISNTSTAQWSAGNMKLLFQAKYKTDGSIQPITNTPLVVDHPESSKTGNLIIVGTGRWLTTDDATTTGIQSIYGIWDDMSNTPLVYHTADKPQLVEQTLTNQVTQVNGYTVRTLTNNAIGWDNTGNAASQRKGWYIDLDVFTPTSGSTTVQYPGERAIRNFQVRGDFVFVNTVIPKNSTACTTGPGGYEFGFSPKNGGSGSKIIFDVNDDGTVDSDDNVSATAGDANIVVGIRYDKATPADSAFISNLRVTQTSDQEIHTIKTNTGESGSTGRLSWREIVE